MQWYFGRTQAGNSIGINPGSWGIAIPRFWDGGRGASMKYYYTL